MVTFINKSHLIADKKFNEWIEDGIGVGLLNYAIEKSYEVPMVLGSDEYTIVFQYKKNGEWMLERRPKDKRFSDLAIIKYLSVK